LESKKSNYIKSTMILRIILFHFFFDMPPIREHKSGPLATLSLGEDDVENLSPKGEKLSSMKCV
jgi:hypothetical protein